MSIFSMYKSRGFSFVEVLIAVAVIAVLSTVAFAALGEARKKARDTQRKSDLEQIHLALRLYKDENASYPTGHDAGTVIGEGGATTLNNLIDDYLPMVPLDPMGPSNSVHQYVYVTNFNCSSVGTTVTMLYAKSMEISSNNNWLSMCNGVAPGTNTYAIILQ